METVGLLGLLGVCSVGDIRKKSVHIICVLCFGILGVFLHLLYQRIDIKDMLGGMLVGALLLLISILSKEKIGKGDALVVLVSGIYLGFWGNITVLWVASFLSGITGIILLIAGKRNCSIPFVPFLLVSYVFYMIFINVGGGINVS